MTNERIEKLKQALEHISTAREIVTQVQYEETQQFRSYKESDSFEAERSGDVQDYIDLLRRSLVNAYLSVGHIKQVYQKEWEKKSDGETS